ncbi:hypothetical protein E6O75_ATG05738 [Venturia nashicola]|uniref:Uncharacterized protein n=1 Tax=Venturia nashicola TaxID=86259 RepID=A0A4Z1NXZ6_9PEZI|nr:hypothetical protein E6O75_ATG05738 [Venturia nashicola]
MRSNDVAFGVEEKDFRGDGTAFARDGADVKGWKHAVGRGSVNPHTIKGDEEYSRVAACFNEEGLLWFLRRADEWVEKSMGFAL